jgi:RNA polymerase sigma-70 factor (ECF subfamily)
MFGDGGKARISMQDWEMLYRGYFPELGGYFASRGLSPTEAEELAQDVLEELGQAKVPQNAKAYIYTIAKNTLARHRRQRIAERTALEEYCRRMRAANGRSGSPPLETRPSEEAPNVETERMVRAVLAMLPPRDVQLLTLRFLEGLSVRQVARRMKCTENALSKRVASLRTALRRFDRE